MFLKTLFKTLLSNPWLKYSKSYLPKFLTKLPNDKLKVGAIANLDVNNTFLSCEIRQKFCDLI